VKIVILLASALTCLSSSEAQITASLNHLPNSLDEVRVRNDSTKSLIAFAVTVKQNPRDLPSSDGPLVVYSDPLVDPAKEPLQPGEERVVMRDGFRGIDLHGKRLLEEPLVKAGIFSDGSRMGDSALLTWMIVRRSNMLAAVETSLETLSDAGRRNVSRDQLIDRFKSLADSLRRWYLPPEQQVGISVYQPIIARLMELPLVPLGSPFPPAEFVVQETAVLRNQRLALMESKPNMLDAFLISKPF
jgi:hypothetical protein